MEKTENGNEECTNLQPKNICFEEDKENLDNSSFHHSPSEVLKQKHDSLLQRFEKELLDSNYEQCLEIAIELFAMARVLFEIYDHSQLILFQAYINLIKAYRKNAHYQTAEKHLLKMKTSLKKQMQGDLNVEDNNK